MNKPAIAIDAAESDALRSRPKSRATLFCPFAAAVFLGGGAVMARALSDRWQPLELSATSLIAGSLALSVHMLATGSPFLRGFIARKHLVATAILSLLGTAAALWLVLEGISSLSASSAGFLLQLDCIAAVLLGVIFLGERLSKAQGAGVVFAIVGAVIVAGAEGGNLFQTGRGGLSVAAGASLFGVALVAMRVLSRDLEPLQVAWLRLSGAAPLVVALLLVRGEVSPPEIYHKLDLLWLLYVVTNFYLSYVFISVALKQSEVWRLALLMRTTPLFAALGGILFLEERPSAAIWVGAVVIAAGVAIADPARGMPPPVGEEAP